MLTVLLLTCTLATAQCVTVRQYDTMAACEAARDEAAKAKPETAALYPLRCETRGRT
jgi:hypothetical protein